MWAMLLKVLLFAAQRAEAFVKVAQQRYYYPYARFYACIGLKIA